MSARFLMTLLILLFAAACDEEVKAQKRGPEPRGPEQVVEKEVKEFRALIVPGKTLVKVTKGATRKAVLKGPGNYLKDLTLHYEKREVLGKSVEGLVVDLKTAIKPPLVVVEVQTPDLIFVDANGPGQVEMGDFSSAALTLRADKAARITLAPSAYGRLDVEASGAGRVLGPQVMAEDAHLRAYGSSRVILGQVARLKKDVVSPAKIAYGGKPEMLE